MPRKSSPISSGLLKKDGKSISGYGHADASAEASTLASPLYLKALGGAKRLCKTRSVLAESHSLGVFDNIIIIDLALVLSVVGLVSNDDRRLVVVPDKAGK